MSRRISGSPEWKPGAGLWSEPLGATWVGAEQHLVTGGGLGPASPLLTQELLEPVGGEGESLAAQLHQVGILQPRVSQAVLQGGPAPARPSQMVSLEGRPRAGRGSILPYIRVPILDSPLVRDSGQLWGNLWSGDSDCAYVIGLP